MCNRLMGALVYGRRRLQTAVIGVKTYAGTVIPDVCEVTRRLTMRTMSNGVVVAAESSSGQLLSAITPIVMRRTPSSRNLGVMRQNGRELSAVTNELSGSVSSSGR